jgi:hypothetical protein
MAVAGHQALVVAEMLLGQRTLLFRLPQKCQPPS